VSSKRYAHVREVNEAEDLIANEHGDVECVTARAHIIFNSDW